MDEARWNEANQWVVKAQEDLTVARLLLSGKESDAVLGTVVYHCQQSVEKVLKAYLTSRNLRFQKTHDLNAYWMFACLLNVSLKICKRLPRL
jgi:HEPN domain-containing protein